MLPPIQNLSTTPIQSGQLGGKTAAVDGGGAFKDFLLQSIREVNSMQTDADKAIEKLATGGDVTPAEVLTAVQKADVAFHMMMQVRNKMIDAFQQVQDLRI